MASQSTSIQQAISTPDSPVVVKSVLTNRSYQCDHLEEARVAVLDDLGPSIPMVSFDEFLETLAPPLPNFDLEATIRSLRSGREPVLNKNQWSKFCTTPKYSKVKEEKTFDPMSQIFTEVVAAIMANSNRMLREEDRAVDFLQNPRRAPTSAERRNESKPDGYFVLKNRQKPMLTAGEVEDIRWADIALACEYKRDDNHKDQDDDVRKQLWSMQHLLRDDARHRASFGLTIENTTTRLWFGCRSIVIVSQAFNFVTDPEKLIKLFAAFAFADENSLGFDDTIQPVARNMGQFDITVHPHDDRQNLRKFRTRRIISSYGAEPLRGRGSRVFEAVELDGNGEAKGSNVVLKDFWIDSDRMREGDILAAMYEEAEGDDKILFEKHFLTTICHGDVWIGSGILDDTAIALMRGLKITSDHIPQFDLQRTPVFENPKKSASGSEGTRGVSRVQVPGARLRYADKTHYRIVFKEICVTIERMPSIPDVMAILDQTVTALRLLRKLGWVHRDVSLGNILSYNGQAKLADLEYAKRIGDSKSHEMRTGTMHFMSVEVAAQAFLFSNSGSKIDQTEETKVNEYLNLSTPQQDVKEVWNAGPFSHNHLHDLESLWWVAVWVVFHNHFSESGKAPSVTIKDTTDQLTLAQTLFPPASGRDTRLLGFQGPNSFRKTYIQLPSNKHHTCAGLNVLREALISHYRYIESTYPGNVDPTSSSDSIYASFSKILEKFGTDLRGFVLEFIPDIRNKLLKNEKSKRPRSGSMNEAQTSRKTPKT